MPSARSYCGRQPSSRSAQSIRLQTPAGIPGPPGRLAHGRAAGYPVERGEQFPDCGARAGAQVDGRGRPGQRVEPVQRGHVRRGRVPDMYLVPQPRTIPGRPVGPGNHERDAFMRLDHLAQDVRRPGQLQPGPHLGVRPDRVEVPQG